MAINKYEYIDFFEYVIQKEHSKKEIAKKIGVSPSTMTNYIKDGKVPTMTVIRKLCLDFNIPVKMILNYFYNEDIDENEEYLINRKNLIENINISKLIERIKEDGHPYTEIGERIGLPGEMITRYSKNESAATCELFRDLCREFHIKPTLKKDSYKIDIHSNPKQKFHNERSRIMEELEARYAFSDDYEARGKEYKKIK